MRLKTKYKPALTAIENKPPDHSKYTTTPEFNRLTAERFSARLAQVNLASQNDIANFVKKTDDDKLKNLNKKIISNIKTHVLAENNFKHLQTFDSSPFIGKSYCDIDVGQLYLILQPLFYFVKRLGNTEKVVSWKSIGLSVKKLTTPTATDNSLSPLITWNEISIF